MSVAIQVKPAFFNLPTEILVHIYNQLLSFSDVFHFAATCKQFNSVYCQNTNIIYNHISRKCIQCRYNARQLLANQKGIPVDTTTPITASDVQQICQNACTVTECLKKYNSDFIAAQCAEDVSPSCNRFFGGDPRPQYLRRTEEPRFIRTVYQLWGLCLLNPQGRRLRFKSLKLKDLVTVKEFAWTYRNEEMDIILPILKVDLDKQGLRPIVDDLVFEMEAVAKRAWDCDPEYFFEYSTGWRPEVPLGIADDIHNWVKDIVAIGRYLPGKRLVPAEELWDDTSDEEIMDKILIGLDNNGSSGPEGVV